MTNKNDEYLHHAMKVRAQDAAAHDDKGVTDIANRMAWDGLVLVLAYRYKYSSLDIP